MSNYENIIKGNLQRLYSQLPTDLADTLPATQVGEEFLFQAFGESCRIAPQAITIGDKVETGPAGIVISLYALQGTNMTCQLAPFKAFREIPDSMPYVGAFASHTERVLIQHLQQIENKADQIIERFSGLRDERPESGDFALILYPLPKIALNYIFYRADDEFPATVTCLFSSNAATFLPTDALADAGEYTSKKILDII